MRRRPTILGAPRTKAVAAAIPRRRAGLAACIASHSSERANLLAVMSVPPPNSVPGRTERPSCRERWLESAFVVVIATVYAGTLILARFKYQASQDAYWHFAAAREIASGGLRGEAEPRLPWTILAQMPVDHYFGFHLMLAPFAALPNALWGLKLATLAFFVVVPLALLWFLRARAVQWAWAWCFLPLLFSNQDWRYLMLRGGNWMLVLSLLFLQAAFFMPSVRRRRVSILLVCYLATLSYQGGVLLLPLHVAALLSAFALRRDALDRSRLWEPALTALGLALGFIVNPYMNASAAPLRLLWFHVSYMNLDPAHLYPGLREFGPMPLAYLPANPVFIIAPCVVLGIAAWVVVRAVRGQRPSYEVSVLLGAALVGMALTARAIRMREYGVPWAMLFVAAATPALAPSALRKIISPALALATCLLLLIQWPDTFDLLGDHLPNAQYEGARPLLQAYRGPPVLNIAEGDYTTLRWEDPDVAVVQGLSHYFLYPNRPVFDDVSAIRDSPNPAVQLSALHRFYQRGVRLVAVQQRHASARLFEQFPAAFRLAYRSPASLVRKRFVSNIYVIDPVQLKLALARSTAVPRAPNPSDARAPPQD